MAEYKNKLNPTSAYKLAKVAIKNQTIQGECYNGRK